MMSDPSQNAEICRTGRSPESDLDRDPSRLSGEHIVSGLPPICGSVAAKKGTPVLGMVMSKTLPNQRLDSPSQEFLTAIAKYAFHLCIDENHFPVAIRDHRLALLVHHNHCIGS
jgi:hypothetical protein